MLRRLLPAAVLLALMASAPAANAYWPYMGYGYGLGYGNGWGMNPTNYVPAPPYYAVHPPVYYSPHITARHYGASPYAWYPGMQPIQYVPEGMARAATEPMMIENQWFSGAKPAAARRAGAGEAETSAVAAATEAVPAVEPLKITNPFVVSAAR